MCSGKCKVLKLEEVETECTKYILRDRLQVRAALV